MRKLENNHHRKRASDISEYILTHCDAATAKSFLERWKDSRRDYGKVIEKIQDDFTVKPAMYTNAACNKFTEYGNKVALKYFLDMDEVERACKLARLDFIELQEKISRGFSDEEQRKYFLWERDYWFTRLKEKMKDLRISKETLARYNLDWKACKTFAYQTI